MGSDPANPARTVVALRTAVAATAILFGGRPDPAAEAAFAALIGHVQSLAVAATLDPLEEKSRGDGTRHVVTRWINWDIFALTMLEEFRRVRRENAARFAEAFRAADTDGDGLLSLDELLALAKQQAHTDIDTRRISALFYTLLDRSDDPNCLTPSVYGILAQNWRALVEPAVNAGTRAATNAAAFAAAARSGADAASAVVEKAQQLFGGGAPARASAATAAKARTASLRAPGRLFVPGRSPTKRLGGAWEPDQWGAPPANCRPAVFQELEEEEPAPVAATPAEQEQWQWQKEVERTGGIAAAVSRSVERAVLAAASGNAKQSSAAEEADRRREEREAAAFEFDDLSHEWGVSRWRVAKSLVEIRTFYANVPEPPPGAPQDDRAAVCKRAEAECMRLKEMFNAVRVEAKDHVLAWTLFRKLLSNLSIATAFAKSHKTKKPSGGTKGKRKKR